MAGQRPLLLHVVFDGLLQPQPEQLGVQTANGYSSCCKGRQAAIVLRVVVQLTLGLTEVKQLYTGGPHPAADFTILAQALGTVIPEPLYQQASRNGCRVARRSNLSRHM